MFNLFKSKNTHKPIEVTDENFNEMVMKSELPVIIDFYAVWCQPCQVMISLINRLNKEEHISGKVLIVKVNIEANPALAQHFKIQSIPTVVFIENNKIVERSSGLIPYNILLEAEKLISNEDFFEEE